jgi:signal transduction histidine kinase
MTTSIRPASPESSRTGAAVADLGDLPADEQAAAQAHANLVVSAIGPAVLVWGPDALCLAYNRAYRAFAGFRVSALGRPLFKAQPEIERAWKVKMEQALAGQSVMLDGGECAPPPSASEPAPRSGLGTFSSLSSKAAGGQLAGEVRTGWIFPVIGPGGSASGAVVMMMDITPVVEPLRRSLSLLAVDLRESLVGVRVLTERLVRAPRINPDRITADLGRILEMTAAMERTTDDMSTFARFAGSGAKVAPRPGDLAALVRAACEELGASESAGPTRTSTGSMQAIVAPVVHDAGPVSRPGGPDSPARPSSSPAPQSGPASRPGTAAWLQVTASPVVGAWDPDAIRLVVVNLVMGVRRYGAEGGVVAVEVGSSREGASITVRGEGRGPRDDEIEQLFEPWRRTALGADKRWAHSGLGLFIARELVQAHGGRLLWEHPASGGFALRAAMPTTNTGVYRRT